MLHKPLTMQLASKDVTTIELELISGRLIIDLPATVLLIYKDLNGNVLNNNTLWNL